MKRLILITSFFANHGFAAQAFLTCQDLYFTVETNDHQTIFLQGTVDEKECKISMDRGRYFHDHRPSSLGTALENRYLVLGHSANDRSLVWDGVEGNVVFNNKVYSQCELGAQAIRTISEHLHENLFSVHLSGDAEAIDPIF